MTLHDELINDPLDIGYAELSDTLCADSLNAQNRVVVGSVSRPDFVIWAALGPRSVIEDTALNTQSPFRSSALALRDFVSGNSDSLDLSNANVRALLGAWTTSGLITQAQEDALITLATKTISRAEELGLGFVHASQVRDAR